MRQQENKNKQLDGVRIYNLHEHMQYTELGEKFLNVMDRANITMTVLVGSPEATVLEGRSGFTGYDENNADLLQLARQYPDQYQLFCTIYPKDPEKLEKLKQCMKQGSKGLKLYSGHSVMFYDYPLNATDMYPVYAYLEENHIPVIWHVNAGKPQLYAEFVQVLDDFPDLVISCPHFCLSSINLTRLAELMEKYPHLYTDISFGFFVEDGLKRISTDPQKYKDFFTRYASRTMFGTDMVITENSKKTEDWMYNLTMCYRDVLEKERYNCSVGDDLHLELDGLVLSEDVLAEVYQNAPERFLGIVQS